MDAHPDASSSPTEAPQLLSAKFLRKTKFRKEELSKEHAEALSTVETTTNRELKEKRKSTGTGAAASNTPDAAMPTNSAAQASSSLPEASVATLISKEDAVGPNNKTRSSPEGVTSITSDAAKSSAETNTVPSSSSVSPLSSLPTELESRLGTLESSFALSPEELDHAKTLVLDLLGWGVDPEYLIDSGVSAEVVFRVFTDLNLRLPKNLVVSKELVDLAYSWGPRPSEFTQTV